MEKLIRKLLKLKTKTVITVLFFGLVLFLLGGGFSLTNGLVNGFKTVAEARFGVTSLFFVGFLFTGVFGLALAYKNKTNRLMMIVGFCVTFFSYLAIEVLYNAVGVN